MLAQAVFSSILALTTVLGSVAAAPVTPTFSTPDASTVWTSGDFETITWDPSSFSAGDNFQVTLWTELELNGSPINIEAAILAKSVDATVGSTTVQVPGNVPAGTYWLADSGSVHASADFQIKTP